MRYLYSSCGDSIGVFARLCAHQIYMLYFLMPYNTPSEKVSRFARFKNVVERNSGRRLGSKPPSQYNSMRLSITFLWPKPLSIVLVLNFFFFFAFYIFWEKYMYVPPSPFFVTKLRDCLEYTLYVFAKYNHSYQLLQEFKHPNEKSSRTNNLYTWFLQEIIR